jgi:hypothetical protein
MIRERYGGSGRNAVYRLSVRYGGSKRYGRINGSIRYGRSNGSGGDNGIKRYGGNIRDNGSNGSVRYARNIRYGVHRRYGVYSGIGKRRSRLNFRLSSGRVVPGTIRFIRVEHYLPGLPHFAEERADAIRALT